MDERPIRKERLRIRVDGASVATVSPGGTISAEGGEGGGGSESAATRTRQGAVGRFAKKYAWAARQNLRFMLPEGCYTVEVARTVAKSRTEFYFVQRCARHKNVRCQLLRYAVALQVEKIAPCNRAYCLRSTSHCFVEFHIETPTTIS